ncbi:MAG TPA: hypothetical protein VF591_22050 [Pyrinomonadaceae bacterium]|jgi:hypothetical protein
MLLAEHPTVKQFRERPAAAAARLDSAELRRLCLDAGADDVGFVEVGRPELAGQRDKILAAFPRAKSLVSFVVRMNRENIRSPARSVANLEFHHAGDETNEIARRVVAALERRGVRALNPAVGFPMEMDRIPDAKIWVVSHKHPHQGFAETAQGLRQVFPVLNMGRGVTRAGGRSTFVGAGPRARRHEGGFINDA